jgi:cyclophilin family peptidyl-prolyl cis-trans isomerase
LCFRRSQQPFTRVVFGMFSFSLLRSLLFLLSLIGIAAPANAAPVAPSDCVAAGFSVPSSFGTAAIGVSWTDNSTDEVSWHLRYSTDNGLTYKVLGNLGSTTTGSTGSIKTFTFTGPMSTTYLIRVYTNNGSQLSASSNVATVTPGLFTVTPALVPNQVAVKLTWPNVNNAAGYDIYKLVSGGTVQVGSASANATGYQVNSNYVAAGNAYQFVVVPYLGNTYIAQSDPVGIHLDVITSKTGTSGTAGAGFSHTFTQVSAFSVTSRSLKWNGQPSLPPGLGFNPNTGALSGTYPPLGNYVLKYSVNLSSGVQLTQDFAVRVRPPAGAPLIGPAIPAWNGIAGSTRVSDLAGSFTDPEAASAVRVATSLGDMDFILYDTATPATVANFKNYVNSGRFADAVFHRSMSGFMIQGGGFKGTGSGRNFTSVVTDAPVVNEPGISNLRGTLSMAKLSGDPDSATSQFFINLKDNSANLDYQNAGFTVFGRVAGNGMAVADAIAGLPTATYDLLLDGSSTATPFANFPMNAASAPASMDQTKLVRIHSVAAVPTIGYSVTGNTNPTVATASVIDGKLHLVGLAPGQTTITVTGTDLDHLSNTQTVEVNISDTYAGWAARNTFQDGLDEPGENPDGDSLNNLEEYAFLGDPNAPDENRLPTSGFTGASPEPRFLTLTFPVRKLTSGLNYLVEGSDSVVGAWTTIWNSADGFSGAQVVAAADQADRTVVTIRDNVAIGASPCRFLRVRIEQE